MGRQVPPVRKSRARKQQVANKARREPVAAIKSAEPAAPLELVKEIEPVEQTAERPAEQKAEQTVEPIERPIEPMVPAMDGKTRLNRITNQWRDLAERRLQYYTELYQSGRWQRYYSEEQFAQIMRDVVKAVTTWRKLAGRQPEAADKVDLRPTG